MVLIPLKRFAFILPRALSGLDLRMLFQLAGQQFIPNVSEYKQRFISLGGIEKNPVIWIANIQFRITGIGQMLIHAGDAAICITRLRFIAVFFDGFLRPVGIKGQKHQPFSDALVGYVFAPQNQINALSVRKRILRIMMKLFENGLDGAICSEFFDVLFYPAGESQGRRRRASPRLCLL